MVSRISAVGSLVVVAVFSIVLVAASSRERRQVGAAGVDYPTYSEVPPGLSFTCSDKIPGYYADPEAQCQVWHWCIPSGQHYSFLCPNQTLFNQVYRVCDWWYNVDCSGSPDNYNINEDLYKIPDEFVGRSIDQPDPVDEEISDEA
ncbi:U-scoloptoxin(01)-Er1a-like [Homarus americanus]|uniref:U-scoloptoxin(01)-Er1a-like n=1 Tax=Homarus americanus TaxID=6706 RepID=UPI001C45F192|nr:U-scoloptoxin(01)-Er1a-like [Homarus americanus]